MTLSTEINKVQYTCNGDTDTFPYTFKIIQSADLYVVYTDLAGEDTTWTESTEYTVTAVGEELGGNVVVEAAYVPASGTTLTIYREVPLTQESDYVENDPFHADTLESDLDRIIMITQQLDETFSRVIQLNITDGSNPDMTIPNLADRTDRYLGFDENGDLTVFAAPAQVIGEGTDNAITRYDGTDELQTSLATIDDSGNIYTPGNIVGTNISASYLSATTASFDSLVVASTSIAGSPGDGVAQGLTIDLISGEALVFGEVVYMDTDGLYKAGATSLTKPAIAIATSTSSGTELATFLFRGTIESSAWSWTIGGEIYVSESAGAMTQSLPGGSGSYVQVVGVALSATAMYFNPDYTRIEVE